MSLTLVSVEEYLSSIYEPDLDYVDGELEDRHAGQKDHSKTMLLVARRLTTIGHFFVAISTRIKVSPARFRVPDLCVYSEEPEEQIFVAPPLLVIEVVSPEDRMSRMLNKIEDYRRMRCPTVWLLDHWRRKAYQCDGQAIVEVHDALVTPGHPELTIAVSDIFPLGTM